MSQSEQVSFLDRPAARVTALACAAASLALLTYIHRDDLFPGAQPEAPADNAYQACVTERHGQIDTMISEGVVSESQATLFKSRAEALCRATADQ